MFAFKEKSAEQFSTQNDFFDVLSLARSENVGPKTFFELIKIYGTAREALSAIPHLSKKGGKREIKISSRQEVEKEIKQAEKIGARIITFYDSAYPKKLKEIFDPPPVITTLGRTELLDEKIVAIVGSRNASQNYVGFSYKISKELAERNFVIASGLARGIDTAAHKASVKTGTIAVLAGGVDNIYPPENKNLYKEISENGLIISEQKTGTKPVAQYFPARNRIISAISEAVAIIEASLKSGSLITARLALEQGKDVFAVPGFPLDPRSEGTNKLIKQGAMMLQDVEDIIQNIGTGFMKNKTFQFREEEAEEITEPSKANISFSGKEEDELQKEILSLLSTTPLSVDEISRQLKTPINKILIVVLELELAGKIARAPENKITLTF